MAKAAHSEISAEDRLPEEHDIQSANQLRQILSSQMLENETVKFTISSPGTGKAEIELGKVLSNLFLELLRAVGSGNTVISMPLSKKMTTQEAADILNVSRPHLIKLLGEEKLPFEMVGRHRRIQARDVFLFQQKRDKERSEALTELFQNDVDLL